MDTTPDLAPGDDTSVPGVMACRSDVDVEFVRLPHGPSDGRINLQPCPLDGAPLAETHAATNQPTVFVHRDGTRHLDRLAELPARPVPSTALVDTRTDVHPALADNVIALAHCQAAVRNEPRSYMTTFEMDGRSYVVGLGPADVVDGEYVVPVGVCTTAGELLY